MWKGFVIYVAISIFAMCLPVGAATPDEVKAKPAIGAIVHTPHDGATENGAQDNSSQTAYFNPSVDCKVPYLSVQIAGACIAKDSGATSAKSLKLAETAAKVSWFSAAFVVVIAFFSLQTAQRAKEANRAWLLPFEIKGKYTDHWIGDFGEDDADDIVSIKFPIKNVGKSPALRVKISTATVVGKPASKDTPDRPKSVPQQSFSVIIPEEKAGVWAVFKDAEGASIAKGPKDGYVFLDVFYKDIFSLWWRSFRAVYQISCQQVGPDDFDVSVTEIGTTKIR